MRCGDLSPYSDRVADEMLRADTKSPRHAIIVVHGIVSAVSRRRERNLTATGRIDHWLSSGERDADAAVSYMSGMTGIRDSRVRR